MLLEILRKWELMKLDNMKFKIRKEELRKVVVAIVRGENYPVTLTLEEVPEKEELQQIEELETELSEIGGGVDSAFILTIDNELDKLRRKSNELTRAINEIIK